MEDLKMQTQLFNAVLMTEIGLVVEDVEAEKVEQVIPILQDKLDFKHVCHFVIYLGEKI